MRIENAEQLIHPVDPEYLEYLRDESRLTGEADSISFPAEERQIRRILEFLAERGTPVTVQSGRTGISGGAVPRGGHVMNLSRMDRFLGLRRDPEGEHFLLRLQPGVLLSRLNECVTRKEFGSEDWSGQSLEALEDLRRCGPYFFPPDPTETSAAVGGMTASNASGARSFRYGPTRRYIRSLRLVLSDGSTVQLHRGGQRAAGLSFTLDTEQERRLTGSLPSYSMPVTKNTAGLYVSRDMELIDLVIGSEGTLGVVTEIEAILIPAPGAISGVMGFFTDLAGATRFVERIRGGRKSADAGDDSLRPAAIEFFDTNALELLREQKRSNPAFSEIPEVPVGKAAAVYVEYHGGSPETVEESVFQLAEVLGECGGDEDVTWLAENSRELQRMKDFRHALPEAVNLLIDQRRKAEPGLTKLGTDMAVPDDALQHILEVYQRDLRGSGLHYVLFGHIGDNHVHVNILPRSQAEYEKGRELYRGWAEEVVGTGGSVSAEHGIGKLKTELLQRMYGDSGVAQMRRTIEVFNPGGRLNSGNIVGIRSEDPE